MNFIELKCKNCGAKLEVEEGTTQVTCKFCDTTFSIDDAYTEAYKRTKGVLQARDEQFQKSYELFKNNPINKFGRVFVILFAVIFIAVIGFAIFTIFHDQEESAKDFNYSYEIHAGKSSSFFIVNTLDDIVTNNKTNKKHIIAVSYKDITTTEEKEIKSIRNSLDSYLEYDVSLDYDDDGFINKFTISDID